MVGARSRSPSPRRRLAFFPEGLHATVRMVGMEVTPGDDAGKETVRLTVSPSPTRPDDLTKGTA